MLLPEPAHGPYVGANGADLECTVLVKAAPERSAKYGETVCTAAILDDGRLVRLYPVAIDEYWKKKVRKFARVKVKVQPSDEPAKRPESHKLLSTMTVVNEDLCKSPAPWAARMTLLAPAVTSTGMKGLRDLQSRTRCSLGIVKVRKIVDFRITAPLDSIIEEADYRESRQKTLTGQKIMEGSRIDKLQHVFRYRWRCHGTCCDDGGLHNTTCEDWELFQSFRAWRADYTADADLLNALKTKYYDQMGQSDLHFVMGTPSDPKFQKSWMIIGLVYPGLKVKIDPNGPTLCERALTGNDVLKVSAGQEVSVDESEPPPKQKGQSQFF